MTRQRALIEARQLLAGTCSQRYLGASPQDGAGPMFIYSSAKLDVMTDPTFRVEARGLTWHEVVVNLRRRCAVEVGA